MNDPVVLHIDTGRELRGGQRQLLLSLKHLAGKNVKQIIAAPTDSELLRNCADYPTVSLSASSLWRKMFPGKLLNIIDQKGVNIIHAHDSESHLLGLLAGRSRSQVKLVVTRRVIFAPASGLSRKYKYARGVDAYIAISQAVANILAETGVAREIIEVIYSGIDIKAVNNAVKDEDFISDLFDKEIKFLIVSAGALTDEKDFATAIDAVHMAGAKIDGLGLAIMGEGPLRSRLEKLINEKGFPNIRLAGYWQPLAPIFKAADLFLLTSRSEGLNTSALEAAACGLPLVVSDVGGLPEIARAGQNALLCQPGKADEFAAAIVKLYNEESKRREMALKSKEIAAEFSIDKSAEGQYRLYQRVLE